MKSDMSEEDETQCCDGGVILFERFCIAFIGKKHCSFILNSSRTIKLQYFQGVVLSRLFFAKRPRRQKLSMKRTRAISCYVGWDGKKVLAWDEQ